MLPFSLASCPGVPTSTADVFAGTAEDAEDAGDAEDADATPLTISAAVVRPEGLNAETFAAVSPTLPFCCGTAATTAGAFAPA